MKNGFLYRNTGSVLPDWWLSITGQVAQFDPEYSLIPDNLKTGVERTDWYTPQINRTYHEMSEHYNTAVIPARVSSPKDKPAAESTVGVVSKWITAAIHNEKFFTVEELNKEIHYRLKAFNHNPFQKKEGCRYSVYLEEKPFLQKLDMVK